MGETQALYLIPSPGDAKVQSGLTASSSSCFSICTRAPGGLVKTQPWAPPPVISHSAGLGWGLTHPMSNKLPGELPGHCENQAQDPCKSLRCLCRSLGQMLPGLRSPGLEQRFSNLHVHANLPGIPLKGKSKTSLKIKCHITKNLKQQKR